MRSNESGSNRTLLAATLAAAAGVAFVVAAVALRRYGIAEARNVAWISLAYIATGLFAFRFAVIRDVVASWVFPVGLALAALEITNICLEQFVGLPSPANAVVPASMMALIVLFASTSAVVGSAGHNVLRGVVSAVAGIALGMLVSCAAALVFAQSVATSNPEALSRVMLENTAMHLTLPLFLAVVVSLLAVAISKEGARHPFRVSLFISLAAFPLLFIGVVLLVHAASLPRVDRPSFVLPGMAVSVMALTCLPCLLGRTHVSAGTA